MSERTVTVEEEFFCKLAEQCGRFVALRVNKCESIGVTGSDELRQIHLAETVVHYLEFLIDEMGFGPEGAAEAVRLAFGNGFDEEIDFSLNSDWRLETAADDNPT